MADSSSNLPLAPDPVAVQARLAAIVESSDDAIASKTLEGIITSWNAGAHRIFGYSPEEAIGQPMTLIIPVERHSEEVDILSRLRRGERVDHFETIRRRKDGRLIEVSVTISPIRNAAGIIIGASKIARDITTQKMIERELIEARKTAEIAKLQAETASKAKDHFLSVLSHELRTPLTPVLASLGLLESLETIDPSDLREQLSMIRRNVQTEARLVDDLLDLTRIARGKITLHLEVVDAHTVIRSVLSMLQPDIDAKGLSVTLALRAKTPHVWADPGRFQQILLNLLSNAVKFTPADGAITIRSSDAVSSLRIDVEDTGVGIEPDVLPRLFNPFEQGEKSVTRRFGGLGLGLSIVKSLADLHRATISATSAGPGAGATFTLAIPTVPPSSIANPPAPNTSNQGFGYRVLLVEDHPDTRTVLTRLLTAFGCTVTAAGSVQEALTLTNQGNFDLLVSDIGLPDGSGLDVMKHVHDRLHIPGIALSGFGQDEDLARSRAAGFATHLTKPVNLQSLRQAIATYGTHPN